MMPSNSSIVVQPTHTYSYSLLHTVYQQTVIIID